MQKLKEKKEKKEKEDVEIIEAEAKRENLKLVIIRFKKSITLPVWLAELVGFDKAVEGTVTRVYLTPQEIQAIKNTNTMEVRNC